MKEFTEGTLLRAIEKILEKQAEIEDEYACSASREYDKDFHSGVVAGLHYAIGTMKVQAELFVRDW